MTLWGAIVLVVSGVLWFLSSSSTDGKAILGPVYGQPWVTIFMVTGVIGLILVVVGLVTRRKPPAPPSPPAPPAPPKPPTPPTSPPSPPTE